MKRNYTTTDIDKLIEAYRAERINTAHPNTKPFRTEELQCDAVDLSGRPVEGDCIVCVSHSFNNGKGYSKMEFGGKPYLLHRVSWEAINKQSIPEGYEADHICQNRPCINPVHLQVLSGESHRLKTLVEHGKRTLNLMILREFLGEGKEVYQFWGRSS